MLTRIHTSRKYPGSVIVRQGTLPAINFICERLMCCRKVIIIICCHAEPGLVPPSSCDIDLHSARGWPFGRGAHTQQPCRAADRRPRDSIRLYKIDGKTSTIRFHSYHHHHHACDHGILKSNIGAHLTAD